MPAFSCSESALSFLSFELTYNDCIFMGHNTYFNTYNTYFDTYVEQM